MSLLAPPELAFRSPAPSPRNRQTGLNAVSLLHGRAMPCCAATAARPRRADRFPPPHGIPVPTSTALPARGRRS